MAGKPWYLDKETDQRAWAWCKTRVQANRKSLWLLVACTTSIICWFALREDFYFLVGLGPNVLPGIAAANILLGHELASRGADA